jgi:signal transduction histidine kinase
MIRITRELAHGMSLLLESSEADIERARAELRAAGCAAEAIGRVDELLGRARARAEAVRIAIEDSNAEGSE